MYVLKSEIKQDPARRWALPDRLFFGHGACQILAGAYLERFNQSGYWAIWIKPRAGFGGSHIFVTDGQIAFDYHGYSVHERLLSHHKKVSNHRFAGWTADTIRVDFSLFDTAALNKGNMRGPDQYFGDVISRARRYLDRIEHDQQKEKVMALL